jgi:hypothetical protein
MVSLDIMARYYIELLLTVAAAVTFAWLVKNTHVWWRRFLSIVALEFSLFLLTFSGCSAMSNFPGQTRTVSAIGNLSVGELRWTFGLILLIPTCLAIISLLRRATSSSRILANVALYSLVFLASFILFVRGCAEGCTRRFPIAYAPDGKHFARVQELDAGAMDSFHTAVMLRTGTRISGVQIFGSGDGPDEVHLTWVDGTHLRIDYDQWMRNGLALPDSDFFCNSALGVSVICVPHALEQK